MLRYRNLTEMTAEQYQEARKYMGYSVPGWCEALGISVDLHKSMNSGRRDVQSHILAHIRDLEELLAMKAQAGE